MVPQLGGWDDRPGLAGSRALAVIEVLAEAAAAT